MSHQDRSNSPPLRDMQHLRASTAGPSNTSMIPKYRYYPESRVAGFSDIDGTIAFHARINALLQPSFVVLDIGCGRGAFQDDPVRFRRELVTLRGKCQRVIGLDVDPDAATNPDVDDFHLLQGPRWPIADESVDLCRCDFVLEHVDDPDAFFSECRRVLREGGYLCLRTANVNSYVGLFSRVVPNRFHTRVLRYTQSRRKHQDVFPTRYRCNTPARLKAALRKHGFHAVVYTYEAEPSYLDSSRLLYRFGVLYQRYAPAALRVGLLAYARKGVDFAAPAP